MKRVYKAHIRELTGEVQTVKEHSINTANLCREFAIPELKEALYTIGLLHDVGKYTEAFQKRINGEKIAVEHSICGAIEVWKAYQGALGILMAFCIAGHHSGLPDGGNNTAGEGTLYARLQHKTEDYSVYKEELERIPLQEKECILFLTQGCNRQIDRIVDQFAFWTRYAFSCLTDADSLDTAAFCRGDRPRQLKADFAKALELVNQKLGSFVWETDLQKSRSLIQKQAFAAVDKEAEIYLLNMPTGSGKTLCSVKLALERAIKKNKKRIIYIIPFNSIIDQTAEEFEDLFGKDADILRHQSTFSYEDREDKGEDYREAAKCATENWDAPFIITTAVQFFESVYANKRGKLRKMHNMADSLLVFDEAHLMPQKYLQPCLQAIAYITKYLQSEALFLTATMPDFEKLIRQYALPDSNICNLVTDTSLFPVFQKCCYRYLGKVGTEVILSRAEEAPSALLVVNEKKTAREIYRYATGKKYHLSTYLAACDRVRIISEIKRELQLLEEEFSQAETVPEERRIRVISTSLIEAGVNLDFHRVFRELAGLDHILQAGGRCNREGKRAKAEVGIFEYSKERKGEILEEHIKLTKDLLEKYTDISDVDSIQEYYEKFYFMKEKEIQRYAMHQRCRDIRNIPFKEYAEQFELIDSRTISIVVERDEESRKLLADLRQTQRGNARQLQKYVCSVNQKEFEDLLKQHVIEDYGTGIWCLTNQDYYDENLGILFEAKDYIL